uniref:Methyltransferase n=1 Tax=Oryza glumipatula TaxID=40148 RepID=A0A0E0BPS9_9ORYZ
MNVWVMNVVPVDSPDTLPIIYERGLFGMYHDWCESFSTYPRSYDLLHADHLFSKLKKRSLHTTFFRHFPHSELS